MGSVHIMVDQGAHDLRPCQQCHRGLSLYLLPINRGTLQNLMIFTMSLFQIHPTVYDFGCGSMVSLISVLPLPRIVGTIIVYDNVIDLPIDCTPSAEQISSL